MVLLPLAKFVTRVYTGIGNARCAVVRVTVASGSPMGVVCSWNVSKYGVALPYSKLPSEDGVTA